MRLSYSPQTTPFPYPPPLLSSIFLSLTLHPILVPSFFPPLYFYASFSLFLLLSVACFYISNPHCLYAIPILSCILPHFPSYPCYSHPLFVHSLFRFSLLLRLFFPFSFLFFVCPTFYLWPYPLLPASYPDPIQHPSVIHRGSRAQADHFPLPAWILRFYSPLFYAGLFSHYFAFICNYCIYFWIKLPLNSFMIHMTCRYGWVGDPHLFILCISVQFYSLHTDNSNLSLTSRERLI